MISEEEEKAFQELGKKIDRLASIREHIDQAELEALNREYINSPPAPAGAVGGAEA